MPDYYPETNEETPDSTPKDEMPSSETALLPKSILAGKEFNVGDEVVLKIVAMHDDEVEVEYAKSDDKPKSAMDESMDSMGEMMKGTDEK